MINNEIDYKIYWNELQCVEIELDEWEAVVWESWNFMMMEDWIKMETIFWDWSSQQSWFMWKLFSAWKRLLTWESLFMTAFYNTSNVKRHVTFAAPYPWKIIPINLSSIWWKLICQKDSFLCSAKWVTIWIEFQKNIWVGLFWWEWFLMQKLEWDWYIFVHAWWTIIERDLEQNETIKVDTWCVVWFTKDINYNIEFVWWIKNTLFWWEWLFFVTLRWPWKVFIQSLPINRLSSRILKYAITDKKEEWSVLWWIWDLLSWDNNS